MSDDKLPLVSRLKDGRLFFMGDNGVWLVLENGDWVEPDDMTLRVVPDSTVLTHAEIRDLMSNGLLPQ